MSFKSCYTDRGDCQVCYLISLLKIVTVKRLWDVSKSSGLTIVWKFATVWVMIKGGGIQYSYAIAHSNESINRWK